MGTFYPMRDGYHVYHLIQFRTVGRSSAEDRNGKILPVANNDWSTAGDNFNAGIDPHHGTGNDWRSKYPKSSDEQYNVWCKTGDYGWWNLDLAVAALKRCRVADKKGAFDSYDGYRNLQARCRHEFRVVRLTISKKTEVYTEPSFSGAKRAKRKRKTTA